MERRCYGCMKMKQQSPSCEHCGFDERRQNHGHQLPIGKTLGEHYLIGRVLGQGGFGITYLGYDENLDIPVAIKEFYPSGIVSRDSTSMVTNNTGSMQFKNGMDRFLKEARVLARLQNVHEIVKIYNVFQENGTAYIVMEYVEGLDLRTYLKRLNRLLTPQETFAMLRPVMWGLEQVHRAGLVHRDISPDNIMLQRDGTIKLLDFGTARGIDSSDPNAELPHSTQTILKHGFAPMEQYQSRGGIGPWTDEYALCATAYYCMTGRVPPEATERIMGQAELNWSAIPGITQNQVKVLEKGMAIQANARFQSILELEQALFTEEPEIRNKPKPEPVKEPVQPAVPQKSPKEMLKGTPSPTADKMETKPKQKKGRDWIAAVLTLVLLVVLVGASVLLAKDDPSKPAQIESRTDSTLSKYEQPAPVSENLLMAQSGDNRVFGSDYRRDEICSIAFMSTMDGMPKDAWDVSEKQDGSVMAFVMPNGSEYNLFLVADGAITAPKDCSNLFSSYRNLESIFFNGNFSTTHVEDMSGMFKGCTSITNLDLSCFDTSNVTNMRGMFNSCTGLNKLDISSFNTSAVVDMAYMFNSCLSLVELDLSGFDSSNVIDMSRMLYNVCPYTNMELELGTWEVKKCVKYNEFMVNDYLYKGVSWEKLFKQ